jgi:ubiquitin-conjugating enzyme E2 R
MLADPNTSSPANVDASVEWRKDREAFETRVKKLAEKAKKACPSHVKIPHPDTDPEERARFLKKMKMLNEEDTTWMDEVDDDDMDDMDDDDGESEFIDDDDDLEDDEEPVDDE